MDKNTKTIAIVGTVVGLIALAKRSSGAPADDEGGGTIQITVTGPDGQPVPRT